MESWKELVSHIDWFINKSDEGGTTTMKDNDSSLEKATQKLKNTNFIDESYHRE